LKNLKVSILIANYNNQYYLEECIKSIKSQTYKNIEVIFHDDFSSDESLIKASKFKNLKIIKNKKRGKFGSFNQMNAYQRAFNKSTGEIIFFLDSDDFFKKNKVKDTVNEFLKNNKISAIFDLPIIKYEKKLKFAKNKKKLLDNYWPYIPPQSCISIRRKHFKKMMNKVNFNLFPDIWMDFRIALYLKYISKNFFILNNNLTFYRQSPKMVSSNFKFLSTSWLKRRMQAHNYVKYFYLKNKINYRKNLDYFITAFVNLFI
jgi:glycosyltransferase involved in cell wall biosynthesis|tara:strand:+ start:131 stop:910 length:780 start_codon:yes stop_codon:yes gene_type:complete